MLNPNKNLPGVHPAGTTVVINIGAPQHEGMGVDYIQKIVEYAIRKFKQKMFSSTTEPIGPIETRGAVRAEDGSVNDFSNF